jgi:hypothetical protein
MGSFSKSVGGGKKENRIENDCYPTPPFVTYALVETLGLVERFSEPGLQYVLEPCAGRGWMALELKRLGLLVVASDLFSYEDPLCHVTFGVDAIEKCSSEVDSIAVITNPPYFNDFPQKFIEKCLDNPKVELLCVLQRLAFMESKKRLKLFTDSPPSLVAPISSRFSCKEDMFYVKPLSGMVAYAWYVWDKKDKSGITKMRWIDGELSLNRWRQSSKK